MHGEVARPLRGATGTLPPGTRSLFVVSLPRSLSSLLYDAARRSLGFAAPPWTTAGEILNRDRFGGEQHPFVPAGERFTTVDGDPDAFVRMTRFLGGAVEPAGFAYKDVVQPFVVSAWAGLDDLAVLKIRRDPAEIAFAMLKRQWDYPAAAASLQREPPWSIVEGLVRAELALEALPGVAVEYEAAVLGHDALRDALAALYPGLALAPVRYIDRRFVRTRRRLEAERRESPALAEIRLAVAAVRERLLDLELPEVAPGAV